MLPYASYLLAVGLLLVVLALATDLLAGHCGRLGMSAVFFAGLGGYTYAILVGQTAIAPCWCIVGAVSCGAVVAALIAPVMIRMSRDVFLLASLGLLLALVSTARNLTITGGSLGITSVRGPVTEW